MRSTPRSEVSGGPRTYVGLWLRALLRGDSESYRRLVHKLNRGEKGWNDDEPAVVEAACQLAVRQFFSTYHHVQVNGFVADIRNRISKAKAPPRQEDIEVVIRAALDGDDAAAFGDIKRSELLNIRGAITGNVTDILKLDAESIDQLITEAEGIAISRGYSPPLALEL